MNGAETDGQLARNGDNVFFIKFVVGCTHLRLVNKALKG
jgi:hypothetical protein